MSSLTRTLQFIALGLVVALGHPAYALRQSELVEAGSRASDLTVALRPDAGLEENVDQQAIERVLAEDPDHPVLPRAEISPDEAWALHVWLLRELPRRAGFSGNPNSGCEWLRWQLLHILQDASEIRARQDAVAELMRATVSYRQIPLRLLVDPLRVPRFDGGLGLPPGWDGGETTDLQQPGFNLWNLAHHDATRALAITIFLRRKWPSTPEGNRDKARDLRIRREVASDLWQFLDGVSAMAAALHDIRALRLRQLRWVLRSVTDPAHPYGIAQIIHDQGGTEAGVVTLLRDHPRALSMVLRAVRELDAYGTLARVQATGGLSSSYQKLDDWTDNFDPERAWTTRPTIKNPDPAKGPILHITQGHAITIVTEPERHKSSVPNDLYMDRTRGTVQMVPGPNQEGKSTVLRMAEQLVAWASLGGMVPAAAMTMTPLALRAHMHGEDTSRESLGRAQAKHIEEIVRSTTDQPFALVAADEIMPGTNWVVRMAAEQELVPDFASTGALYLVATHNVQILDQVASDPRVIISHVQDYRLLPGSPTEAALDAGALQMFREAKWPEERTVRIGRQIQILRRQVAAQRIAELLTTLDEDETSVPVQVFGRAALTQYPMLQGWRGRHPALVVLPSSLIAKPSDLEREAAALLLRVPRWAAAVSYHGVVKEMAAFQTHAPPALHVSLALLEEMDALKRLEQLLVTIKVSPAAYQDRLDQILHDLQLLSEA